MGGFDRGLSRQKCGFFDDGKVVAVVVFCWQVSVWTWHPCAARLSM